jgi:hypothetical protein
MTAMKISSTTPSRVLHTPTTPEDHLYHDSSDCPHGAAITRSDNDSAGTAFPRRCNWCTEHGRATDLAPQ